LRKDHFPEGKRTIPSKHHQQSSFSRETRIPKQHPLRKDHSPEEKRTIPKSITNDPHLSPRERRIEANTP